MKVLDDLSDILITVTSRRGWGKSTITKHLVKWCKDTAPDRYIFKVFDSSLVWLESPIEYRQTVTRRKIREDRIDNIGDCYFILDLGAEDSRAFIASIIEADYRERFDLKLKYGDMVVKSQPMIVYVIEEANTVFSTTSLNKSDRAGEILTKFVSVGRNFNLTGLFVCTGVSGELSTRVRRRSEYLLGKLSSVADLNLIKKLKSWEVSESTKKLEKHQFIYSDQPDQVIQLTEVQQFKKPKLYRRKLPRIIQHGLNEYQASDQVVVTVTKPSDPPVQPKPLIQVLSELIGLLGIVWLISIIL